MTTQIPVLPPPGHHAVFRNAAWTAASQVMTMGLGAALGIVLVLRFGKSAQTDAAFAAAGVYGVLLALYLGFRITVAPRLAEGPSPFARFDHYVGASMSLLLVSGIVLVGLGDWVAAVLGGRLGVEAQATIRVSLAILWIALIAQLVGALGAALLGVRGEFGVPGLAYVLGALGAFVCLLLLPTGLGVLALPVSTAVGSVLMAGVMLGRMLQFGYVPGPDRLVHGLGALKTVALLLVASISPVAWQLNYLISLAFAARLGPGAVTLYTYSFAAAGVVTGITASAGGLVLAGQLAQTWDRRPESLDAYLTPMFRVGLLIALPILALAAWIGTDVIVLLLGRSLTRSDATTIVVTFLMLSGMMIGTLALQVPSLGAYALGWYGRMAFLMLMTSIVQFALTALAHTTGEITLLGQAASISTLAALLLVIGVVYGKQAAQPVVLLVRELGQLAVVCAIAFGSARAGAAAAGDGLWALPAVVAGMAIYALLLRVWLPGHYDLAVRIAQQVLGARQPAIPPRPAQG